MAKSGDKEDASGEAGDEMASSKGYNTGRWTEEEHERFLQALELYGKKWNKV